MALASHDPAWLGADETDNVAAEFTAFAHAQLLAHFFHNHVVVLRPDLHLSYTVAAGLTSCKKHPKLAKLLRCLHRWASTGHAIQEVRGHNNHPWNELADSIAKHAAKHAGPPHPPHYAALQRLLQDDHEQDWAWPEMRPSYASCMPPITEQVGVCFTPSHRPIELPTRTEEAAHPTCCTLHLVSCNVLALESTEDLEALRQVGRIGGHRTARLDAQMHERGAHIIGVQEARSHEGRHMSEHYLIFASGALIKQAPLYGCEIWLHKSAAIATTSDGKPLRLAEAHHVVLHADPRRLLLSCELAEFDVVIASLRAPCLGKYVAGEPAPLVQIQDWWTETSNIIHKVVGARSMIVLIDANAPVSDMLTDYTGGHHPDKGSPVGDIFEDFITTNKLFVPSTFAAIHLGSSATWTHSSGKASRRDYVLLSKDLFDMTYETKVLSDHDNLFGHEGHLPAQASLCGWIHCSAPSALPKLDPEKMLDKDLCQQFQQALFTLPLPTWDTDVDHHCSLVSTQLVQLAQQFFGRTTSKQKKFRLAQKTLEFIAFKRHLLDFARGNGITHDPTFKAEIKCLEQQIRPLVAADVKAPAHLTGQDQR